MPKWTLRRGSETFHVEVTPQGERWRVRVEASGGSLLHTADVAVQARPPRFFIRGLDGPKEVIAIVSGPDVWVAGDGYAVRIPWMPYARPTSRPTGPPVEEVRAPMTGRIVDLRVQPGQAVEAGAVLLVIEAMKMEVQVQAPQAAVVTDVWVQVGDPVDQGQVLLRLRSRPADTEESHVGGSDHGSRSPGRPAE